MFPTSTRPSGIGLRSSIQGLALAAVLLAGGCADQGLAGTYFDVRIDGAENTCTGDDPQAYFEQLRYRLEIVEQTRIIVAVEEDEWAEGTIDGCFLDYRTIVNTSLRNGLEIRWRIDGEAEIDLEGGNSCLAESDVAAFDWIGTERFTVVRSADPNVDPGCTYTVDVTGRYVGPASDEQSEPDTIPPTGNADES